MSKTRFYFEKLMMLFGFFAAAPLVRFFSVTGYVFFLLIATFIFAIMQFKHGGRFKNTDDILFVLYMAWTLVSYFFCKFRMDSLWTANLATSFIQFVALIFLCVCLSERRYSYLKLAFVKGVYYSAVFQLCWCLLQFFFFKIGIDINTVIFKNLLHMASENASHIAGSDNDLSGLCWHPSNLAVLFLFGYSYTKNVKLKVLFVATSIVAGSRTLLAGMLLCVALDFLVFILKKQNTTHKRIAFFSFLGFVICVSCFIFRDKIAEIWTKYKDMFDVAKNFNKDASMQQHIIYIIRTADITSRNSLFSNIFGFGPGCSGYVFSKYYGIYQGEAWTVECDYVNILWQYGYAGFLIYYSWVLVNIVRLGKLNIRYCIFFISFLVMGVMYNVTFNWVFLLIVFVFSLGRNGIDIYKSDSCCHKAYCTF